MPSMISMGLAWGSVEFRATACRMRLLAHLRPSSSVPASWTTTMCSRPPPTAQGPFGPLVAALIRRRSRRRTGRAGSALCTTLVMVARAPSSSRACTSRPRAEGSSQLMEGSSARDNWGLTLATEGSTHLASLPRMLPAATTEASMTRSLPWQSACSGLAVRGGCAWRHLTIALGTPPKSNQDTFLALQELEARILQAYSEAAPCRRRQALQTAGVRQKGWASTAAGDVRRHAESIIAAGGDLLPVLHVLTVRGS
mmetsp:Transcript_33384/g.100590  ORF Transcript_33384/g.100590 Transcript_33384/m.100590 type:complete len:255 (+) Transcript_33384:374-1138(+)